MTEEFDEHTPPIAWVEVPMTWQTMMAVSNALIGHEDPKVAQLGLSLRHQAQGDFE